MRALYLTAVFLHVLAAMVWVGGMAAMALLLVPAVRREPFSRHGAALLHFVGTRFRAIGWTCLGLLVVTGTYTIDFRVGLAALTSSQFWREGFGRILAYKLVFVALIIGLGVLHDFFVGPRATALLQATPESPRAQRLRRAASWMGRLTLLVSLAVVALALQLVRGGL